MGEAGEHGLDAVLAATGEHGEEVDAECARKLPGAAAKVQLLHHGQAEPRPPHPVLHAPPAPACRTRKENQHVCPSDWQVQVTIGSHKVIEYGMHA